MADIEITARDLKYPGKTCTLQINKSMAMEDLQQRLPLSFVSELKDGDLLMVEAINKDEKPSKFID
jgi:hypothetical protein